MDTHSELLDRYAEIETLKSANNVSLEGVRGWKKGWGQLKHCYCRIW